MELKAHRNETTGRWTLEGVEPSEKTFDTICQKLRSGENFKFARYGDGEAACMLGKIGHNCDGHEYFPELGAALNNAFYSNPDYMVGIQPLMVQQGTWSKLIQREGYPKNIYDADVLHSASIDGRLRDFVESIQDRHVIVVGQTHLRMLFEKVIEIPERNCWNEFNDISEEIFIQYEYARLAGGVKTVFLLCASMMSEVLIHRFKDRDCTIIDCGSVFDVYCNKPSRSYHKKKSEWILN